MPSLYIHIPFCQKKCFYCSFVVAIAQDKHMDVYLDRLDMEAQKYSGTKISTVYLGGGTPTYLQPQQLSRLAGIVKTNFVMSPDVEWTVEANPEGLTVEKIRVLQNQGVTRFSLGIQTFKAEYLKYLGRCHDAALARDAFVLLRSAGCGNVSVDLMFAFPGQSEKDMHSDIELIAGLDSEHVSVYSLTIEENSRFFAQHVSLDDAHRRARLYQVMVRELKARGLDQYEVSNFSRRGFVSQHNLAYWQGQDYIGLGVGAHSYLKGERFWNVSRLNDYLQRIGNCESSEEGREKLWPEALLMELLNVGLRMNQGVVMGDLEKLVGVEIQKDKMKQLEDLVAGGLLRQHKGRLQATDEGRLVLDEIATRLI